MDWFVLVPVRQTLAKFGYSLDKQVVVKATRCFLIQLLPVV